MPEKRLLLAWLARGVLGMVTLLAIGAGADTGWSDHHEELDHTAEKLHYATAPPDCGIRLSSSAVIQGDMSPIRVVLAVDDAWLADERLDAPNGARLLFWDLMAVFDGLGIQLKAVRFETWVSSSNRLSVSDRLAEVETAVALADDDIVLALTGQRLSGADGKATIGGRYALVGRHPGHPERDLWVAAHEIGHLFGARHSEESKGAGDIMSSNGFGSELYWTPCHERLLSMNASRFE